MLTGYRTLIFNAIMLLILVYRSVQPNADLPDEGTVSGFLDGMLAHWDALVAIIGNVVLRFFTKTAVLKSK